MYKYFQYTYPEIIIGPIDEYTVAEGAHMRFVFALEILRPVEVGHHAHTVRCHLSGKFIQLGDQTNINSDGSTTQHKQPYRSKPSYLRAALLPLQYKQQTRTASRSHHGCIKLLPLYGQSSDMIMQTYAVEVGVGVAGVEAAVGGPADGDEGRRGRLPGGGLAARAAHHEAALEARRHLPHTQPRAPALHHQRVRPARPAPTHPLPCS